MDRWLLWCVCSSLCLLSGLLSVPFLFAGRHGEQGAALVGSESLTGAEATESFRPDPSSPTPFSSVAVTAPVSCHSNTAETDGTQTNTKDVRRGVERKTMGRDKERALWHGGNHCPRGIAIQPAFLTAARKILSVLWNMSQKAVKQNEKWMKRVWHLTVEYPSHKSLCMCRSKPFVSN